MGLLQKSISISSAQKISFSDFVKKYNISLCAVLKKCDQNFVISNSYGFDAISIISSVSSLSFWEGTIKEKNKWYSYKNNAQMLPFYQFFSFNQKDKIDSINIYFSNNDQILLICGSSNENCINSSSLIDDFNNINYQLKENIDLSQFTKNKNESAQKYSLNFSKVLEHQINANLKKNECYSTIENALVCQIEFNLKRFFPSPNYVSYISDGIFHILYKTEKQLPLSLLSEHIKTSFKDFLDDDAKLIEVSEEGKAASYKDLLVFLQAE